MPNQIHIKGGFPLHGEVAISGSKNAISAILPALCLLDDRTPSIIKNIPDISDITTLCCILEEAGLETERDKNGKAVYVKGKVNNNILSTRYVPKIRASSLFLGSLLSITGEAHIPFCGGDQIGVRPLDIHFYIFDKYKIRTHVDNGYIHCQATEFPLKGATVYLRYPSVGATENALMLAVKAEGTSYIYNAACEPEITDLAIALNKMGGRITGAGTPIIRVHGVKELRNITHEIIPDRLELCTLLLAITCTRGKGKITGGIPDHCISVLHTLIDAGVKIEYNESDIFVDATTGEFKPIKIQAMPYPGIPTDVQALLSVFATQCEGNSVIEDSVFKDRFSYIDEYMKMGIETMQIYDHLCINGPQKFKNASVYGKDIRAASALIIAGLVADGESIVYGYEHLSRGYEDFDKKLRALGANIEFY